MFQILSANHYAITPDSSGLRGLPNRTPLWSDGSLPPRPTSHSDILNCAAPAHPRTISLYGRTLHNHYTEIEFDSPHGAFPAQRNHTITLTPEYIYLTIMNNTRLLQEHTSNSPTPSCHHWRPPPVKAVITHDNARDSLANPEPLSTNCFVYNSYPLSQPISEVYNPRCAIATHVLYIVVNELRYMVDHYRSFLPHNLSSEINRLQIFG